MIPSWKAIAVKEGIALLIKGWRAWRLRRAKRKADKARVLHERIYFEHVERVKKEEQVK